MQSVSDYMSSNVNTLSPNAYIADVLGVFIRDRISGAPVVDGEGAILGFISKTDVIRFESTGGDPAYVKVTEIANPDVVTTHAEDSIHLAAQKMLDAEVHHLVVEDSGKLVGIISTFDLVRFVASGNSDSTRNLDTGLPYFSEKTSGHGSKQ